MIVRKQKVVIEFNDGVYLTLFDNGDVRAFATPEAALKAVQRASNRGNKDITVTAIEWRGVPEGFVPPKGAK